jgi:hypothetical protein
VQGLVDRFVVMDGRTMGVMTVFRAIRNGVNVKRE